ncbi:MAG: flagellar protein FliL [Desulfovibrionales bacterium]|jgi:flagellar FliL protein|nr:flagellar protein FliL [Desulfovibrionales bacterium]
MIFLVPDDDDLDFDAEEELSPDDESARTQLDQGEIATRATQKVDLDLDDAPFLEEEEEEEEEIEEESEESLDAPKKERKRLGLPLWLKNKYVLLGALAAVLLLAVGFLVNMFFFGEKEPPPPPPEPIPTEAPGPEQPGQPKAQPKPELPGEIIIRLDPFWVEQKDGKGDIRFLFTRFALTTTNEQLAGEFQRKLILVRDAVFYYLKNKNLAFLSDKNNSQELKKDLLTVINQYMGSSQFQTLLIEQYLIK